MWKGFWADPEECLEVCIRLITKDLYAVLLVKYHVDVIWVQSRNSFNSTLHVRYFVVSTNYNPGRNSIIGDIFAEINEFTSMALSSSI